MKSGRKMGFSLTEKIINEVLRRRNQGISSINIAKELSVSKGTIDRILYPAIATQQKINMAKRYKSLKSKGICHMCGQKKPLKP